MIEIGLLSMIPPKIIGINILEIRKKYLRNIKISCKNRPICYDIYVRKHFTHGREERRRTVEEKTRSRAGRKASGSVERRIDHD